MATTPDLPLVLEKLGLANEDWGPGASSGNYTALAAGWRGSVPVPSEATVISTWNTIQAAKRRPRPFQQVANEFSAMPPGQATANRDYLLVHFLLMHPELHAGMPHKLPGGVDEPNPGGP